MLRMRCKLSTLFLLTLAVACLLFAIVVPQQTLARFLDAAAQGDTVTLDSLLASDTFSFQGMGTRLSQAEHLVVERGLEDYFTGRIAFSAFLPAGPPPWQEGTDLRFEVRWNRVYQALQRQ